LSLARAGARVVAGARNAEKLADLVNEIQAAGGEALALELDVTSVESVKSAFAEAEKAFGPVEILVNNAGVTKDGLAMRMSPEAWSEVMDTNLTGAFRCIQAVMRGMMKQRWGRIINISSVVGLSGNPGQANYVSSKAGLIGLTKSLSQELGSRNITVNAVAPGFIETAMTQALSVDAREAIAGKIPLGRIGSPGEIAHAVCFLAADEAGYITGHTLSVNGGMYC
jgi:3-oxoacyl-[acyl-carrier protein] reductase